jgi:hypothetical protein
MCQKAKSDRCLGISRPSSISGSWTVRTFALGASKALFSPEMGLAWSLRIFGSCRLGVQIWRSRLSISGFPATGLFDNLIGLYESFSWTKDFCRIVDHWSQFALSESLFGVGLLQKLGVSFIRRFNWADKSLLDPKLWCDLSVELLGLIKCGDYSTDFRNLQFTLWSPLFDLFELHPGS